MESIHRKDFIMSNGISRRRMLGAAAASVIAPSVLVAKATARREDDWVKIVESFGGFVSDDHAVVNLDGTRITDAGLECLNGLTGIKRLWLGNNQVTDSGLDHLKRLTNLEVLDIHDTQVSDVGMKRVDSFNGLAKLEYLGLGNTKVSGECILRIRGCSKSIGVDPTQRDAIRAIGAARLASDNPIS